MDLVQILIDAFLGSVLSSFNGMMAAITTFVEALQALLGVAV